MPRDQIRLNVASAISHGAIEQTPAYVACLKKLLKMLFFGQLVAWEDFSMTLEDKRFFVLSLLPPTELSA